MSHGWTLDNNICRRWSNAYELSSIYLQSFQNLLRKRFCACWALYSAAFLFGEASSYSYLESTQIHVALLPISQPFSVRPFHCTVLVKAEALLQA